MTTGRSPSATTGAHMPRILILAMTVLCAMAIAAAAEDFEFTPIDEIPDGQGLVTGPDGEFTILKWDRSRQSNTG
ncbi:MAG: hypothetical protein ACR2PM_15040, partial [Hyphomicrobiales bacterium]